MQLFVDIRVLLFSMCYVCFVTLDFIQVPASHCRVNPQPAFRSRGRNATSAFAALSARLTYVASVACVAHTRSRSAGSTYCMTCDTLQLFEALDAARPNAYAASMAYLECAARVARIAYLAHTLQFTRHAWYAGYMRQV